VDIDIYYCEIVHCLIEACKRSIPRLKVSALKHYWNSTLEDLKQQSILAHNLWKSVGSPRSGDSFNLMRDAKYKYKLAIRDVSSQFESRFDDDLLVILTKAIKHFGNCGKIKFRLNVLILILLRSVANVTIRVLLMFLLITTITLLLITTLITTRIPLTSALRILVIGCLTQTMMSPF